MDNHSQMDNHRYINGLPTISPITENTIRDKRIVQYAAKEKITIVMTVVITTSSAAIPAR